MRNKDICLGVSLVMLSVFYLWQVKMLPGSESDHILNSSQSFPYILGISLLVLSLALVIKGLKAERNEGKSTISKKMIVNGLFYVLLTILYVFVGLPFLGFIYSTLIYMIALMMYFKEIIWYWAIPISAGSVLTIYLLFTRWMLIRLP